MKKLKKQWAYFISLPLLFIPLNTSFGCGGFYDPQYYIYLMFQQKIIGQEVNSGFFYFPYASTFFSDYKWDKASFKQKDNIEEWQSLLNYQVPKPDIQTLVYTSEKYYLEKALPFLGKKIIPAEFQQNKMLAYCLRENKKELLEYLLYAKQCEPEVVKQNYWEESTWNYNRKLQLIDEGIKAYQKCTQEEIKLRYAFQVVRLAHYAGEYGRCISLFDNLVAPLKTNNLIRDWALGHKAGALKQIGNRAEAAYLFSRVFETCPSKRYQAFLSFSIQNDQEWDDCLRHCENKKEISTLYLIRGIKPYAYSIEEMEHIYLLDPNSPHLELLAAREISKLEYDLMSYEFDFKLPFNMAYSGQNKEAAIKSLNALHQLIEKIKQDPAIKKTPFWTLTGAYLDYMTGNFEAAEKTLRLLKRATLDNPQYQQQIEAFQFILKVIQLEHIDIEAEETLYTEAQRIQQHELFKHQYNYHIINYLLNRFEKLYLKQGEKAKSYLCNNSITDMYDEMDLSLTQAVINWIENDEQVTRFEKYLLEKVSLDNALNLKGTILLRQQKIDAAIEVFSQIASLKKHNNPFVIQINAYINIDVPGEKLDKLQITKKLRDLEKMALADPDHAAEYYLQLGNAWYNMSYYGPSWDVLAYYRSTYKWTKSSWMEEDAYKGDFHDCSIALGYYQKAIETAADREIEAKAHFLAAQCEQNIYYFSKDYTWKEENKEAYRTHFATLQSQYADTEYYNQALRECGYFGYYVATH